VARDGGLVGVLDADDGRELGTAPIPGVPDAIWFNPVREHLYVAITVSTPGSPIATSTGMVMQELIRRQSILTDNGCTSSCRAPGTPRSTRVRWIELHRQEHQGSPGRRAPPSRISA